MKKVFLSVGKVLLFCLLFASFSWVIGFAQSNLASRGIYYNFYKNDKELHRIDNDGCGPGSEARGFPVAAVYPNRLVYSRCDEERIADPEGFDMISCHMCPAVYIPPPKIVTQVRLTNTIFNAAISLIGAILIFLLISNRGAKNRH